MLDAIYCPLVYCPQVSHYLLLLILCAFSQGRSMDCGVGN